MKITVVTTEEFEYDIEKETDRLQSCFKGKVLKRQQAIFHAFLREDYDAVETLYNELPYNSKEGCPEQEFVGSWLSIISGGTWGTGEYLKSKNRSIAIKL